MSCDEQERLRDIQDAITAIRRHLEQTGDTAAKEDPLLHDVERDLPSSSKPSTTSSRPARSRGRRPKNEPGRVSRTR
jgi:hypothetical protein